MVEQYFAFVETMAQQRTPMYMKDWIERLDIILMALKKSNEELGKYRLTQKALEKEQSLKELELDIKNLKPKK